MVIPCDFTQICRLCLVKDKVNVFLFDNNDTTKSILEKINSCLPVTVSENDNLPKKICDICLEKLNATYAFQNTTLNSEKQLLTWLAESSSKSASSINDVAIEVLPDTSIVKEEAPDPDIANELNEELHSQIEETEEPVPKRPRRSTALNRPVIEPDTEEDEDVDDVEPISKFESEDEDLEKLDIPSYLDPTTLADQPGPSGVGKESGEPTLQNIEEILHTKQDFTLTSVSKIIQQNKNLGLEHNASLNERTLNKQKRTSASGLPIIRCPICNEIFQTSACLSNHYLNIHLKKPEQLMKELKWRQCTICKERVSSIPEHNQKVHMRPSSVMHCERCKKTFINEVFYKRHMQQHLKKARYIFQKINIFGKYVRLEIVHNIQKPETDGRRTKNCFECIFCEQKLFKKDLLKIHLNENMCAVAREFKNVRCPSCSKLFENFGLYYKHYTHFHKDNVKFIK